MRNADYFIGAYHGNNPNEVVIAFSDGARTSVEVPDDKVQAFLTLLGMKLSEEKDSIINVGHVAAEVNPSDTDL